MGSRRQLLQHSTASVLLGLLAGCGFKLREAPVFDFRSIFINQPERAWLVTGLRRQLVGADVRVLTEARQMEQAEVLLDVLLDTREKAVVALNAAGQVREYQLRARLRYRLRTPDGLELLPATDLLLQRDFSFNDSYYLGKEIEEQMQYRDMQDDLVQQLLRRLAAVHRN